MRTLFLLLLIGVSVLLTSCITIEENYAPVSEISVIEPIPKKGMYRVLPDETLYSIAWRYGLDYRDLAKYNHISPPYAITVGQWIYLNKNKPREKLSTQTAQEKHRLEPVAIPAPKISKPLHTTERAEPTAVVKRFLWPASGPVVGAFSSSNKGINIAGHRGDPIVATAAGKVVYSGHGLRGYGNLIIIKHNSMFLTAYAHNDTALVKSGDWVTAGQKIAEMGNTGAQRVMLHFEIRRNGKPVNPIIYLGRVRQPSG